jgi:hypothetical protein
VAKTSQDGTERTEQVLQGLHQLVEAGRVAEVEAVLTTLVESEPAADPTVEDREIRSYAEGMRDGIALARRIHDTQGG